MNAHDKQQVEAPSRPFPFGWVLAVGVVLLLWVGANFLYSSGQKEVLAGWADGMPAGQQLAREADRPMVVLFTAGWCPPCRALKKDVLTKDPVREALAAGFVPVQIDLTDQSANNPNMQVAQRYGVSGIPAVIAMTPDGQPIDTYAGNTVASFTDWLDRVSQ
jgi:thiol:disulfide interchange protein